MKYSLFFLVIFVCTACAWEKEEAFTFHEIPTPCNEGAEPNLFVGTDGAAYLSWVEYLNDTTDALLFSKMENGQWGKANEVARGSDWFVNWADFPSLAANGDWLAAHWLQKSAGGTYDYDVHISQSVDGGQHWQQPFIVHSDSIAAEHGFATLFPIADDRMFATWLDGRNTKEGTEAEGGHGHGHGGGAMTLRTAEFDRNGNLYEEAELDARICDCCQTDAVLTAQGPVVVYRDRSEHEIRDIGIVRKLNGEWTKPHLVHADNWEIAGCPVNGPAVDAVGSFVAVAWFTSANGEAAVKIAFSKDAGATFSAPVRMDDGNPSGRVDVVVLNNEEALVTWLENTADSAEIRAARVRPDGKLGDSIPLVGTSPARKSGFPILAKTGEQFILAWTAADSSAVVKSAIFDGF